MGGGNLSDQQLKEFDEYLSNSGVKQTPENKPMADTTQPTMPAPKPEPAPVSEPEPKPAPKPINEEVPAAPKPESMPAEDSYLDDIISLHEKKANDILDLLDKIDAKGHKDIVAELVDEMQYQRGIIRREQEQAQNLKQLFKLAADATK